ncbi:MAG: hypothetical protein ACR2LQ_10385 [Acidimicrobiales bacterium]
MPTRDTSLAIEATEDPETAEPPPIAPVVAGERAATDDGRRFARLAEGVRALRIGGARNLSERTLMIAGGIVAPVGLLLVGLGWYGASHTPNLYEQVPYMISGGLLGLGLVFLGAFFYFTHWVTELVKEHRTQSLALIEAIARLEATVSKEAGDDRLVLAKVAGTNGHALGDGSGTASAPARELVATAKGSMAHRSDCAVVGGKRGLRPVDPDEGLLPCKLCDPYALEAEGRSVS